MQFQIERRQIVGPRQAVIHERAGQQLAGLRVIDELLHRRLAEALGDGAGRLSVDDERIDGAADIVDRDVTENIDLAGVGVDLDFADGAAARIAGNIGLLRDLLPEWTGEVFRQVSFDCRPRHVEDADGVVGADDAEFAVGKFHVA